MGTRLLFMFRSETYMVLLGLVKESIVAILEFTSLMAFPMQATKSSSYPPKTISKKDKA